MLAGSHVVAACATWWAVERHPLPAGFTAPAIGHGDQAGIAASVAIVAVSTLLPDLDHPRAALARLSVVRGGLLGMVRPLAPVSLAIQAGFGHRGALHSMLASVILIVGLEWLVAPRVGAPGLGYVAGWGYVAHLVTDALTRQGVPLFWPISSARCGLPGPLRITTGSPGEAAYMIAILAGCAVWALAA